MARRSIIPRRTLGSRMRGGVGISIGSAQPRRQPQEPQEPPRSHVVPTDSALAEMRQVYRTAINILDQQLEALLEQAVDQVERDIWTAALDRLRNKDV